MAIANKEKINNAESILPESKLPSQSADEQKKAVVNYNDKVAKLKIKSTDLIGLTNQLAIMLESGVVLSDALHSIAKQSDPGNFKVVMSGVCLAVENGSSFSRALERYPKVFDLMFVSMVRASEISGNMSEMLKVLGEYVNFESETKRQIKGALAYPIVMLIVALFATSIMLLFVLPRFTKIYQSRGSALPKMTQILVDFSNFLRDVDSVIMSAIILGGLGFGFYWWLRSYAGKKVKDLAMIRMPVLGVMFTDMIITRSMRIMSTMISAGVSLLDTIDIVKDSSNNWHFRNLWYQVDGKIRDGYQLSEAIQFATGTKFIAPSVVHMIKAGEKNGDLARVTNKISDFYEKKFRASIKTAMSLIEPIMITFLGILIGAIAIALLLPVFRVSTIVAH